MTIIGIIAVLFGIYFIGMGIMGYRNENKKLVK